MQFKINWCEMKNRPEDNIRPRLAYQSTVMFEDHTTGSFHYGTMYNFSGEGMYCRSDIALRPGATINVKIENAQFNSAPTRFFGQVRWCKEMNSVNSSHFFEIGIKIIKVIYD